MLFAGLLIFVLILIALGTFVGKFFGGRGLSLLGLLFALGLGWMTYSVKADVSAGALHQDDTLVVYFYLAVFIVMALVFAACYGLLLAKGKLPRQRR